MKQVIETEATKALPEKYVAVFFEGSWLITQDPKDLNRILAICPYRDADNHTCVYGLSQGNGIVDGGVNEIAEHAQYRVEVGSGTPPAQTFTTLFDSVAKAYPIIYVRAKGDGSSLVLGNRRGLRQISIPIPDQIRPAGRLLDTPIRQGSNNPESFDLGMDGVTPSSFVTLIFLYTRDIDGTELRVGPEGSITSVDPIPSDGTPHLIFNVHGVQTGVVDSCSDNLHIISTFDQTRKLFYLQNGASATPEFCDFGMFPTSGDQRFCSGDTGLSNGELGLPEAPVAPAFGHGTGMSLASCGSGIVVVGIGGDSGA